MRSQRQTRRRIVIGLMITLAAVCLVLGGHLAVKMKEARQKLVRLLCETDHEALLEACRQLSLRVTTGELSPGDYWVRIDRQPRLAEVPEAILSVKPLYIHIDREGYVLLEMAGIPFYGVVAYPGTSKENCRFRGDVELIPSLWYYDEDYNDQYPRHQARIDALIRKGKRGMAH